MVFATGHVSLWEVWSQHSRFFSPEKPHLAFGGLCIHFRSLGLLSSYLAHQATTLTAYQLLQQSLHSGLWKLLVLFLPGLCSRRAGEATGTWPQSCECPHLLTSQGQSVCFVFSKPFLYLFPLNRAKKKVMAPPKIKVKVSHSAWYMAICTSYLSIEHWALLVQEQLAVQINTSWNCAKKQPP